jgi:hypothetical protein
MRMCLTLSRFSQTAGDGNSRSPCASMNGGNSLPSVLYLQAPVPPLGLQCPQPTQRSGARYPCVHPSHPLAPPTSQAPKPHQTQRSSPDLPTRKRKSRQSKHYNAQVLSSYADSRASRMTARRWPTQVSVRAVSAHARVPGHGLLLLLSSSVRRTCY